MKNSPVRRNKNSRIVETQKSEYIEILNPSDLKLRPIAEGPSCPTSRLSKLIDILLQPFLYKIKRYSSDEVHLLNFQCTDGFFWCY